MEVERIAISTLVAYFIGYIVCHVLIGLLKNEKEEQLKMTPKDEELKETHKWFTIAFKWFPAAYVLFLLLVLA